MVKALWNGKVIAESSRTEVVEGNHYFPMEDIQKDFLEPSGHTSSCPWKGMAQYFTVVVDSEKNRDAAWYYADPKPAAKNIAGRVAFWKGVKVEV